MSRPPLSSGSGSGAEPAAAAPIVCAGHPRDMGLAQGEALREVIRAAVVGAGLPSRRSRWPSLRPVVSGPLRGSGPGRELFRHFAHQAERLEGLAQGADLPLDSLLAMQLRIGAGDVGPSAAAWIVRESRPVVGFRSIERTLAWLVPAVAGINEAGLALLAPLSRSASLATVHGAPPSLLVQDCLARFENVAGALDWCRKRPVEGERTIWLADAAGARGHARFRGRVREVEAEQGVEGGALRGRLIEGSGDGEADGVGLDPAARRLVLEDDGADSKRARTESGAPPYTTRAFELAPLPPNGAHAE